MYIEVLYNIGTQPPKKKIKIYPTKKNLPSRQLQELTCLKIYTRKRKGG